jgi:hypothetical protein
VSSDNNKAKEITDPAMELAELIDHLRRFPLVNPQTNPPPPVWQVLASGTKLSPESPEIMELLAIVKTRLSKLAVHVSDYAGPEIAKDIKERVTVAIKRVSTAFSPAQLGASWKDALAKWILAEDATALRMFSFAMRNYMPLKKLSDQERENAILLVQEALAEITDDDEFDVWERQALLEGYRRIEFILRYFEFFGHEGLQRDMLLTGAAMKAVVLDTATGARLTKVKSAFCAVALILQAISAPADAWNAAVDYERWARAEIASMYESHKPEQLRLPAPQSTKKVPENGPEAPPAGAAAPAESRPCTPQDSTRG